MSEWTNKRMMKISKLIMKFNKIKMKNKNNGIMIQL